MKIWVIGRNYPLPENGMSGIFELEQAKMLSDHGNEVCYLACLLHPLKRIKKRGMLTWTDENVEVDVYSAVFTPRVFPFYFVRQRNRIWKKLMEDVAHRNGLPDIIHVHYPAMLMIPYVLEEFHDKGVKIVATEHWFKVLSNKLDSIELQVYKRYSQVLNRIICVGSPLARAVMDLTGINTTVIPNTLSDLFKPASVPHSGFRFVAVGRLVKIKQFDKIIEAFDECFHGKKDVSLIIIGSGEEKENLQAVIDERQISSQVQLLGRQDRNKTAQIMSGCDVLVSYSQMETFCVPVIEAWACGLPAVAADTAAVVIDNKDKRLGQVVSMKDPDELKDALMYVYNHIDEYDKEFIMQYAVSHFSEETIYDKLLQVYMNEV